MLMVQMEADSCEIEKGEGNQICKIERLQPIGGVTLQLFSLCFYGSIIKNLQNLLVF